MNELRSFINGLSPMRAIEIEGMINRYIAYKVIKAIIKAALVALFLILKFS